MIPFSGNVELAGFIPHMLSLEDDDDAVKQLDKHYGHGGGWRDFEGFTLKVDEKGQFSIKYPGDPAYNERARGHLREEIIVIFDHGWVMVVQPDGTHRIARMD